jgi:hypothetical protein
MSPRTHPPQQTIISLPLSNLHPHPDNANRMSKDKTSSPSSSAISNTPASTNPSSSGGIP